MRGGFGLKTYKYVRLQIGRFIGAKVEDHRSIIDEHAAKGYRYVGYIPTRISDSGKFKEIDLIFEKDRDDRFTIKG